MKEKIIDYVYDKFGIFIDETTLYYNINSNPEYLNFEAEVNLIVGNNPQNYDADKIIVNELAKNWLFSDEIFDTIPNEIKNIIMAGCNSFNFVKYSYSTVEYPYSSFDFNWDWIEETAKNEFESGNLPDLETYKFNWELFDDVINKTVDNFIVGICDSLLSDISNNKFTDNKFTDTDSLSDNDLIKLIGDFLISDNYIDIDDLNKNNLSEIVADALVEAISENDYFDEADIDNLGFDIIVDYIRETYSNNEVSDDKYVSSLEDYKIEELANDFINYYETSLSYNYIDLLGVPDFIELFNEVNYNKSIILTDADYASIHTKVLDLMENNTKSFTDPMIDDVEKQCIIGTYNVDTGEYEWNTFPTDVEPIEENLMPLYLTDDSKYTFTETDVQIGWFHLTDKAFKEFGEDIILLQNAIDTDVNPYHETEIVYV